MATNEPSVIVNPPVDGRRVTINGTYYGSARDTKGLEHFLWLAGFDPAWFDFADPDVVEWRGGGPDVW
ncbi:hypothetical protein ACIF70_42415 [Actinacidiphila glaucinigra]|uniref:hypothetical protein n=1 Tax=Actinacidiphila glaucinigra TaxID=235986 RepID=UPI0037C5864B